MNASPTVVLWARFERRARHGGAVLFRFPRGESEWIPAEHLLERREAAAESPEAGFPERLELRRAWALAHLPSLVARAEAPPVRRRRQGPAALIRVAEDSQDCQDMALAYCFAFRAAKLSLAEAAVVLGITERQAGALARGYLCWATEQGLQEAVEALQAEQQERAPRPGNGERR